MSVDIEISIIKYNDVLVSVLKQYKDINSKYACLSPDEIRSGYDTMQEIIVKKKSEINQRRDYIKKCMINLEKCNISLEEMDEVLKKISFTSNNAKMSILHSLCKKTIDEYNMVMPEIPQLVYDFPFDEKEEIEKSINSMKNTYEKNTTEKSIGGKNKFSKRNNTKRKNYRAKNGNKKSKNGVL
jgi:hypothetical protein